MFEILSYRFTYEATDGKFRPGAISDSYIDLYVNHT